MSSRWRYICQRALTGEFLDWDLPIEVSELSWELSGPGALRGTVSPDIGQLRADDGDLVLQEWSTLLYAEADGVIRWGGLLISSTFDDEVWSIEAAGFTTYPHGVPYLGEFSKIQVDPARCVREIWGHLQSFPTGDLDVVVTADPTPVRLGTPKVPAFTEYKVDGNWIRAEQAKPGQILKDASTQLNADIEWNDSTIAVKDVNTTQADIDSTKAAQAILFRLANGKPLASDWTWSGCPPEVSAYAPRLLGAYTVQRDSTRWLARWIAKNDAKSKKTKAAVKIRDRMLAPASLLTDWSWSGAPDDVDLYHDTLHDEWDAATSADTFLRAWSDTHGGTGTFSGLPLPFTVSIGDEQVVVHGISGNSFTGCTRGAGGTESARHTAGTEVNFTGTEHRDNAEQPAEPYLLAWYETPDCGDELDSLVQEASYDYTESHSWDGDTIRHEVRYAYPRLGRRRDDLAFVQGDNVTAVVAFDSVADDYANGVVGIGAGEGRKTVRSETAVVDGRMRRVAVYTDKAVSNRARLDLRTREELGRRRGLLHITSIDVVDHPNAPFGSWSVGDDILVRASVPWLGDVDLWCRVTGWTLTGESTASLTLARSDFYTYGG